MLKFYLPYFPFITLTWQRSDDVKRQETFKNSLFSLVPRTGESISQSNAAK